ncbi:serine hydrolase domain-containing protein [Flavobacterium oreochromis]|uniref:Serine hydrolase domain-containing protein n=1 Tax=Flavobacterium oreochromis TaxID=2906078 RepID=A0ABW8P6X9_9FLAO|nr:serine hydrolase domain-containing protein [Flavobacterium oreochromis]OWP76288.1 serine hydrolase [Flavobacterium oreochromis]
MKINQIIKGILLLVISFLFSSSLHAQNLESKIDKIILKDFNDTNGPGGVFLVSQHGKSIYHKAFGKSNLELDTNLTTDNVFQIGSITKQFTAISILILEEQHKLNTQDPISKYITDYPNGNQITIHHLLTHTSGIRDLTKIKTLKDLSQKEMTPEMLVQFFKNERIDFNPGEKFDYNNSGYVILGFIIEKISGKSYKDFIQQNLFDKIGMTQSFYANDKQIIKKRALGYHKKETGYTNKTNISYSIPLSSGALMSTTNDMLKWQNALRDTILLSKKNNDKAFQKYKLNNGQIIDYGYGWHIKEINGFPTREHGGSIFGYKSMAIYFPTEDLYIVGFSNCDCHSPTQTIKDIDHLLTEKR